MNGSYKRLNFKGIMSFYPLIDDEKQLKNLDGWLMTTILHCLKLRYKLLLRQGFNLTGRFPFNMTKDNIIDKCRSEPFKGKVGLMEIPSFLRIYRAIEKGISNYGIDSIMNTNSNIYNYE